MEDLTLKEWFSVHDRVTMLGLDLDGATMHEAKGLVRTAWKLFAGGTPARRRRRMRGVMQSVDVFPPLFVARADEVLSSWWADIEDFRRRQLDMFPGVHVQSSASSSGSAA